MAQPQDRRGLAVAWQDGVDVAELAPEPHQGCPEAGPAALDVGGDPCGDGGAGGLIDSGWHGIHDGRSVTGAAAGCHPAPPAPPGWPARSAPLPARPTTRPTTATCPTRN